MTDKPSSVDIADSISELMYGIAGWLLIGLGGLAFFSGVGGVTQTAGTAEMLVPLLLLGFAFVFLSSGVLVNPRFRRRLDRRCGISRFGRNKTVDRRVLSAAENRRESCVSCGSSLTKGLVRRYRDEFVLAGVPIWTASENRNFYCPNCAVEQVSAHNVADNDDDEPTERATLEAK
jgi:predicted RNA-binding Zn-ribbon protein involved in translation (DUF1610 family)